VKTPVRVALASILALLCLLPLSAKVADTARLTILHTNDTHGHLLPFSYPQGPAAGAGLEGLKDRSNIGGIARRAALARRIRTELESAGARVWLIDAGDFSDGTPFSTEYRGEADVAAMNAAGYDFATIGNHEFNYPLAQTTKLIGLAKYPILCANAVVTATGKLLAEESRVELVGSVRVGLFGLVTREAATYPAAKEGVTILDEIETARKVVASLRARSDVVVLISHSGEQVDNQLAAAVPGIDVIVGGHSHSRLPSGDFVWRSDDLKVDEVNGTVIVQAHQWGGELGRLDLLFAKDGSDAWHVDRYRARLLPITSDLPADPAVEDVVDRFWKPLIPKYGEVVGTAAGDFATRGDDMAEYNLMADAVRETFGTEIELENTGGVRAPLVKGPITRTDLITLDPFDNTVVTFKIPGRDLKAVLQKHRPAVSGIRYRVEGGQLIEATVGGQPIDDNRIYTGATNSYFAGFALAGIELRKTGRARVDVLTDYIRMKGTVAPAYDGRRVVTRRP
jgi:2',3'-cyclic-nucleotide 2'-phosphodiesterase (5'-nucleotidase family)